MKELTIPQSIETKEIGPFKVQYIDVEGDVFQGIYEGGTQMFIDTDRTVSASYIATLLLEGFELHGFQQIKSGKVLGYISAQIHDTYPYLRYCDILKAFEAWSKDRIKVDLKTYKEPLTLKQILELMGAYYQKLQASRESLKKKHHAITGERIKYVGLEPTKIIRTNGQRLRQQLGGTGTHSNNFKEMVLKQIEDVEVLK